MNEKAVICKERVSVECHFNGGWYFQMILKPNQPYLIFLFCILFTLRFVTFSPSCKRNNQIHTNERTNEWHAKAQPNAQVIWWMCDYWTNKKPNQNKINRQISCFSTFHSRCFFFYFHFFFVHLFSLHIQRHPLHRFGWSERVNEKRIKQNHQQTPSRNVWM